ncbi:MAG: flavin reductase family protein [Syntrophorhabdales bacterium]|jgi:flavin reductase (DIM6/NTAB) family NADH-FMN oxidoreductase RutF
MPEKKEVSLGAIYYPMPVCIVGVTVAGKPTFLTVAWFSMVNVKPPYLMVALGKTHYSNAGIKENNTFSINIPSASMAEATDYCGLVSGNKHDKSKVFEVFYGHVKTAPMIREAPYNLECRVVKTVELPADELFIGEVVAAYSDGQFMINDAPDLAKMNPFILSMADRRYVGLGAEVGKAWEIGKKLIKG